MSIQIILAPNSSTVLPACFFSLTHFNDQGIVHIQDYLQFFKADELQAGVTYAMGEKIIAQRHGAFAVDVRVEFRKVYH